MADYDDEVPYIVIERTGSGFFPFLWGAALGAVAVLLLAPKSGAETQEELKERARRLRDRAEGKFGEWQESLQGAVDEGRRQMEEKLTSAKSAVSQGRARAEQAYEAGRKAVREARSELEEEVAQTRQNEDAGGSSTG